MELESVVLQMAAHTILALRILHLQICVIAMLLGKCLGNFLVAIQTVERRRLGSKLMATGALRGTGERLVCSGERAR